LPTGGGSFFSSFTIAETNALTSARSSAVNQELVIVTANEAGKVTPSKQPDAA
jgi:hypothetical protein